MQRGENKRQNDHTGGVFADEYTDTVRFFTGVWGTRDEDSFYCAITPIVGFNGGVHSSNTKAFSGFTAALVGV